MSRAFSYSGTTSSEAEEPITASEQMPSGRVFSYFELRQLAQKRDACKLVKAEQHFINIRCMPPGSPGHSRAFKATFCTIEQWIAQPETLFAFNYCPEESRRTVRTSFCSHPMKTDFPFCMQESNLFLFSFVAFQVLRAHNYIPSQVLLD